MAGTQYLGGLWWRGRLFTWGSELREWNSPLTGSEVREARPVSFACVFRNRLVVEQAGTLRWNGSVIDTNTVVIDGCEAELFGRSGLLVVHRGMQVRFYEPPAAPRERWPYREIYSFYTASEQGGLMLRDVDGDGRTDILCGNYWIQAPVQFELPWRLYAINLINDTPLAASARLAWVSGRLLWLESKSPKARMLWLTPSDDPKQLWRQEPVDLPPLAYPRAVLVRGEKVWIGHANGVTELPGGRTVFAGQRIQCLVDTPAGVVGIAAETVTRLED